MKTKTEQARIRAAIKGKYADISKSAVGKFAYPTGIDGARILGYTQSQLSVVPAEMMKSFCGVGNPFLSGTVNKGESVLDIGCGSGIDLIIAAHYVGKTGRGCGIDITPEMTKLAEQNATQIGLSNVEVQEGGAESIPYSNNTFDVVISNGVLNLSPEKELAFTEIFRVLAPGGRLQFADIVFVGDKLRETPCTLEAWSE
jgi:arsenite methyltransferase